jgi:hypothetical protein
MLSKTKIWDLLLDNGRNGEKKEREKREKVGREGKKGGERGGSTLKWERDYFNLRRLIVILPS